MGVNKHIDTYQIKNLLSSIYDSIYYLEDYGHVGCYSIKEDDVKLLSDDILAQLTDIDNKLNNLTNETKEQYEF
jgi:hypothetical protein